MGFESLTLTITVTAPQAELFKAQEAKLNKIQRRFEKLAGKKARYKKRKKLKSSSSGSSGSDSGSNSDSDKSSSDDEDEAQKP